MELSNCAEFPWREGFRRHELFGPTAQSIQTVTKWPAALIDPGAISSSRTAVLAGSITIDRVGCSGGPSSGSLTLAMDIFILRLHSAAASSASMCIVGPSGRLSFCSVELGSLRTAPLSSSAIFIAYWVFRVSVLMMCVCVVVVVVYWAKSVSCIKFIWFCVTWTMSWNRDPSFYRFFNYMCFFVGTIMSN